jgi:hypothetical protein
MKSSALAVGVVLLSCAGGCRRDERVRVTLEARATAPAEVNRLAIRAQLTGPPNGLRYRWLSVAGECDPQESAAPATTFRFADGTRRDRVTVEVWRDSVRVAESELDVAIDPKLVRVMEAPTPVVTLEITQVPPYDAVGGPDTRADIAGRVIGERPSDYQTVVYARADAWYIQPLPNTTHAVAPDGRWRTWTHTGSSYAVLVIRPGMVTPPRLDVLPAVGGDVVARTVVEGKRR